jgi:hypothetical protein
LSSRFRSRVIAPSTVDPQAADAGLDRARGEAERFRGAAGPRHLPPAGREGLLDPAAVGFRRLAVPPRVRGGGAEARQLEVGELEDVAAHQDHRALHDVLQLPDVAGPRVRDEPLHRLGGDPADGLADLAPVVVRVVVHDARVRAQGLVAAHALELALLEHAQEGDLDRVGQVADLVEEDRAARGQLSGRGRVDLAWH